MSLFEMIRVTRVPDEAGPLAYHEQGMYPRESLEEVVETVVSRVSIIREKTAGSRTMYHLVDKRSNPPRLGSWDDLGVAEMAAIMYAADKGSE